MGDSIAVGSALAADVSDVHMDGEAAERERRNEPEKDDSLAAPSPPTAETPGLTARDSRVAAPGGNHVNSVDTAFHGVGDEEMSETKRKLDLSLDEIIKREEGESGSGLGSMCPGPLTGASGVFSGGGSSGPLKGSVRGYYRHRGSHQQSNSGNYRGILVNGSKRFGAEGAGAPDAQPFASSYHQGAGMPGRKFGARRVPRGVAGYNGAGWRTAPYGGYSDIKGRFSGPGPGFGLRGADVVTGGAVGLGGGWRAGEFSGQPGRLVDYQEQPYHGDGGGGYVYHQEAAWSGRYELGPTFGESGFRPPHQFNRGPIRHYSSHEPYFKAEGATDSAGILPAVGLRGEATSFRGSHLAGETSNHSIIGAAEDTAMAELEISNPERTSEFSLLVRFKGTEVLRVRRKTGELILNSGGWRTLTTRLVLNKCLKPLHIWIEEYKEGNCKHAKEGGGVDGSSSLQWRVADGKSFLVNFTDDMVIGKVGATTRAVQLARASIIQQHLTQVKSDATMRRKAVGS